MPRSAIRSHRGEPTGGRESALAMIDNIYQYCDMQTDAASRRVYQRSPTRLPSLRVETRALVGFAER